MRNHEERNQRGKELVALPPWRAELKSKLGEKVRWDDVTLHLYSNAACFYEITPLAVVIPECVEDIGGTVEVCSKYGVPVLPRGAGSSLSGNAVGEAVILDLSHHFKDVEVLEGDRVRCGVSVVLNQLQERLKSIGRRFGPDPSSGNVCLIGGMLGNNSGGPHTMKHGNMVHHVEEVSMVLANGDLFTARNIPLEDIPTLDTLHRPYYEAAHRLLRQHADAISAERPLSTKNASGYQVWNALTATHLNMASLLIGSEGTLGVFTGAVLKIIPTMRCRGIISFHFADLVNMGKAVKHLRMLGASAMEFVDQSFLKLALSFRPELSEFLPDNVRYLLYVEFEDDDIARVEALLRSAGRVIAEEERLAEIGSLSTSEEEIEKIFRVRKEATVILNRLQGKEKPVPFVEDAAIHPDVFAEFLGELATLLKRYPFRHAIYGHAGDGNLHLRPILDFRQRDSIGLAEDLMERFVNLVVRHKGTLSGEHGDGRLRTPYLHKTFPRLIPLFAEIKNLFDPAGILNPGIKVATPGDRWSDHLRYSPQYSYHQVLSRFDAESWKTEIEKCHGCGTCREYCPVFGATGQEESTARAKANILRTIVSGKLPASTIDSESFFAIMDFCFNCGQCLTDCPTAVNIPGLVMLAKKKLHEKRPYKLSEFILQRGKLVSSASSILPSVSNWALGTPLIRQAMHSAVGIDSRRTLPPFKRKKPISIGSIGRERKKVVLWSGCSANFNDPEGELAGTQQLLHKLGYEVITPPWACCNVAKLSYGNIEGSLHDIEYNLRVLKPYVDQNIPILFSSASCGYAFMHEYPVLFADREDIKRVAESCYDIHDFLGRRLLNGIPRGAFRPIKQRVVYHAPCHLKTQQNKFGPRDLLKLVPDLELVGIRDSCCGIAGTFGMKKENFDLSMKIGSKLFNEIRKASPDVVLSGCGTCQIQIHQGTGLEVIHPLEILNRSLEPASR
jgi:FAD/FMN-containing dehydrogenase/Fe-S oxidoreductase